jgi:DNA-binding CsgD family transcriptional regulator
MKNYGKVPWPEVHRCRLKACRIIRELICTVCTECLDRRKVHSRPAPHAREIGEEFHILTLREAELCSLLARRHNTAEIATCLLISPRTVEKHIASIFKKLDIHSREQLRQRLGVQTVAIPLDVQLCVHERSANQ